MHTSSVALFGQQFPRPMLRDPRSRFSASHKNCTNISAAGVKSARVRMCCGPELVHGAGAGAEASAPIAKIGAGGRSRATLAPDQF